MKLRTSFFILIIFWLMMNSCATRERCARLFPPEPLKTEQKTKTEKKIVEKDRDSTAYARADSARLKALLECDSMGNVLLKQITDLQLGQRTKPSIHLEDNELTVDCKVDSMAVYMRWKERFESSTTESEVSKTYVFVKNYLTNRQVFEVYCGRAFLALLGCMVLYIIYRFRKKLFYA